MFSLSNFSEKIYDYNIKLSKATYKPSRMYQKYILKLYNTSELKFVTYLPNIKYREKSFKLKKDTKYHVKKYMRKSGRHPYNYNEKNCFDIYNKYVFLDFINISDDVITFIGNTLEDFFEQRNNDVFFYVHKTLLFCEDLVSFSPVLTIYSSQLLRICDKLLINYQYKNNKNLSKWFIEIFENLYCDLIENIENIIEIINSTFIDYIPKIYKLEMPTSKILLTTQQKFEVNKEDKKDYKTKFYTTINPKKVVYYISNTNEFVNVCLYHFISNKIAIRKCNNCDCYFIAKRRDAIYCDYPSPQNPKRSCSKVRTHLNSKQSEQNATIKRLYDNIESIYSNNKNKIEYQVAWENFKKLYRQKRNDIIYYKYGRNEMIKWLNLIKSDLLQLYKEENTNISNINCEEELKILGLFS